MSIYAYNNLNNSIGQLDAGIVPFGVFSGRPFDGVFQAPSGKISSAQMSEEQEALETVTPNDVVITSSLTNFSIDFISAMQTAASLYDKNVRVIAYQEDFDTNSPLVQALFAALPLMLKFRRSSFRARKARQSAGIKRAASEGKYKGKPAYTPDDFPSFIDLYKKYMFREIGKNEFAKELGVSRPTLDRLLDEFTAKKGGHNEFR